jgi:tetrapyrrole methylase family protein / MazG family protein
MGKEIDRFIDIVATLRGPNGCPWDKEQSHKSLISCMLDEAYEFFEAVDHNSPEKMCEELGDLLLQIILHAQIASEEGTYTIEDVARGISDKIIHRHPHVFGDVKVNSSKEVLKNWENLKRMEKGKEHRKYLVDDIPNNLPALFKAEKVQRRVARVGFDWPNMEPVLDKVEEEFGEFRAAIKDNRKDEMEEELGDIIFALVNVARHKGICAEDALRLTIDKFTRRFRYIEDKYKEANKSMENASLEEMDTYWEESKKKVG